MKKKRLIAFGLQVGRVYAELRRSFDENSYLVTRDFLAEMQFRHLKAEVMGNRFPAREMRQGQMVT